MAIRISRRRPFEYFDVFSKEIGTTPSRAIQVLTAMAIRLYSDRILRRRSRVRHRSIFEQPPSGATDLSGQYLYQQLKYQGRLKETTQIGGELIGDDSADADAEIIALVGEMLQSCGLSEFQISLGHVGFFRALVKEAGLDEQTALELKTLIKNKNTFGVEKLLAKADISPELKKLFASLTSLFGTEEVLDKAAAMTMNPDARSAWSDCVRSGGF